MGESFVSLNVHALQQPSLVSYFSDEDINEDGKEEDSKEGWEQIDVNKAEMSKKEASPATCTPGKTGTTTPPKKTQSVVSIKKDMKTLSMVAGPQFVHFNFNHKYMLPAPVITYLEDGSCQIYYDYLVNMQVGDNFNVMVSEDGLSIKLQAKIPRAFINLGARACTGFEVLYANSSVIMSTTVNAIVRTIGPDFHNIWSPGQIDPLPFARCANLGMQIMWHEGNNALNLMMHNNYCINAGAKDQMMPILKVTLLSKEVQRKSTMHVEDAVLCCCSLYKSGDCTPPQPPGVPLSTPGPQSNGFGGGFPGAMGEYYYKSSSSSMNKSAAYHGDGSVRVNNKNKSSNNSPHCRRPIILQTVQGYFWRTQQGQMQYM